MLEWPYNVYISSYKEAKYRDLSAGLFRQLSSEQLLRCLLLSLTAFLISMVERSSRIKKYVILDLLICVRLLGFNIFSGMKPASLVATMFMNFYRNIFIGLRPSD
jgi:hypothetical protein